MGFHHVALATKDPEATHAFYTEAMGFTLAKVVVAPTPGGTGGWARHFFYETGDDGLIAFWDLHDPAIGDDWRSGLAKSVGLPAWVNHLAFDAPDLDVLAEHRDRWRAHGITVAEVDHGWCRSIYATDPNGILVEFCCTTRSFTAEERAAAPALLTDPAPPLEPEPPVTIHHPLEAATPAG